MSDPVPLLCSPNCLPKWQSKSSIPIWKPIIGRPSMTRCLISTAKHLDKPQRPKRGRAQVINWLKKLENSEARRAASEGQEPYNFQWMWREMKIDDARR